MSCSENEPACAKVSMVLEHDENETHVLYFVGELVQKKDSLGSRGSEYAAHFFCDECSMEWHEALQKRRRTRSTPVCQISCPSVGS